MQEKYPFLSLWKKDGLKKFPNIPWQPVEDHFIAGFLEPCSDPISADGILPSLDDDDIEIRLREKQEQTKRGIMREYPDSFPMLQDMIKRLDYETRKGLAPMIRKFIFQETEHAIKVDFFKWGSLVGEARKKLFNGADREKVLRELGKKVLPSKRGGASLLSGMQRRTLKNVYLEMKEAIKEARGTMSLNVNHPDEQGGRNEEWGGFIEGCPWADTVFKEAEFNDLLSEKSPADVAAKIIVQRLGRALKTNLTSGRSL